MPEVYAVNNGKVETVAECLLDLIWRHGVSQRIIHDRAAEFLADVLQETAHLMGITHFPTSGGHPQANALLNKLVSNKGRDWDKLLGGVLLAYRTTPHQLTRESPFCLMHGREANLPTALDLSMPRSQLPVAEPDYGEALARELIEALTVARKNAKAAQ